MRKWYPIVLIVAVTAVSLIAYPRLPDRVPTHWNLHGEIDGYGSKLVSTVLMPVVLLGMWGLLRLLPTIDPRAENYAKMQGTYDLVVNSALTALAIAHFAVVAATFGLPVPMARLLPVVVGVLMILVGNALPRARPNWWFGIRTPWTMSNDRVWERTHRVGGYLVVGAGILVVGASFLPIDIATPAMGVVAGGAVLAAVIYSYFAFRQETHQ